jgi:hypothetical protein
MLRFPLPPVPDPSQPIERLSPGIHQQISSWLDRENRSWELLDTVMKTVYVIISHVTHFILENSNLLNLLDFTRNPGSFLAHQGDCTSAQLFSKLSRFSCTIGILAFFLEKCRMYEPLYLLKERSILTILSSLKRHG